MSRILVSDVKDFVGKQATVMGWVRIRRDHGKLIFLDIRDRSGIIQVVVNPQVSESAYKVAQELGVEYAVSIKGQVNQRPGKSVNKDLESGGFELEATEIKILAKAATLPFDMGSDDLKLELPTLLDHRGITLRHPKIAAIFKVQAAIIDEFRNYLKTQGFVEFQAPAIAPAVAEGGAAVFEVNYFGHKAYLSQSPQLYKQIVMSAFERVFSVNKIFRAEPSVTTRHLTEVVSLDAEMAFIDSWLDVKDMAEQVVRSILKRVEDTCAKELKMYKVELPKMIDKTPYLSLKEAQEKIFKNSGRDVREEKDLNPEDEREICEIIKKETGSDFVFIYGYPTKHKPFYVYPNPENPEVNEGMDLLCKGLEWLSGGRRVNDYDQLTKQVKDWKLDPNKIKLFLEAFQYGVPPEGGFALGAERMTMQILELSNVREASIFPRDMERIDERLSTQKKS
ncbi:MAG: aspartate--tRNA(Asn) ligase [Candidatus Levybacteria bacterium RIFCSPLOWO2_01_FULL_36_13]|nr:MAG: aspartate--tRNA(Asn) ligase [Candidatus Levybacteria bacterium RIFCSPHIGHO2_01_FULL_36_15b]OGH35842.1 MAG: aspartate--tRNA(Asn) ligase [Candidatus Levybacteria bacterium RIFCSPLOWO2_01_FULL_36_13]